MELKVWHTGLMDIFKKLIFLYGKDKANEAFQRLEKIIKEFKPKFAYDDHSFWDEKDIALIAYPDSFQEENIPTLKTLQAFLAKYIKDDFSILHILPFFPYSSDRGFSIIEYSSIREDLGSWEDIEGIGKKYRLMADFVLTYVSAKHEWFEKFLAGDKKYWNYFIHFEKDEIPTEQLKRVFRPRSTSLLTPFKTVRGDRYLWTTYGKDQVDLNYKNPDVLVDMIGVLLNLIEKGVRMIRLDAISIAWKEIGTSCRHLPQVHTLISLFREIMETVCPEGIIVTEVVAPVRDAVFYFGEGAEAHIVYDFSLAPLLLYSFLNNSATTLSEWAKENFSSLKNNNTLLNVLDTHDGIKLQGIKGILSENQIQRLLDRASNHGGAFLFHTDSGKQSVYEVNSTWWSALNNKQEPFDLQIQKFITSRAISMALKGIPALYYLSLFGQQNDLDQFKKTKNPRDINRTNLDFASLKRKLEDKRGRESQIFEATVELIKKRKNLKAFHPNSKQEILTLDPRVFVVLRGEGEDKVLALHNVSQDSVEVSYQGRNFILEPYSFVWERV